MFEEYSEDLYERPPDEDRKPGEIIGYAVFPITRNEDPEGGKMLIIDDSDTSVSSRPRKEMICPRCDNMQIVEYWEIQTRSADESPTRFFRCTNCDKNWREYD